MKNDTGVKKSNLRIVVLCFMIGAILFLVFVFFRFQPYIENYSWAAFGSKERSVHILFNDELKSVDGKKYQLLISRLLEVNSSLESKESEVSYIRESNSLFWNFIEFDSTLFEPVFHKLKQNDIDILVAKEKSEAIEGNASFKLINGELELIESGQ